DLPPESADAGGREIAPSIAAADRRNESGQQRLGIRTGSCRPTSRRLLAGGGPPLKPWRARAEASVRVAHARSRRAVRLPGRGRPSRSPRAALVRGRADADIRLRARADSDVEAGRTRPVRGWRRGASLILRDRPWDGGARRAAAQMPRLHRLLPDRPRASRTTDVPPRRLDRPHPGARRLHREPRRRAPTPGSPRVRLHDQGGGPRRPHRGCRRGGRMAMRTAPEPDQGWRLVRAEAIEFLASEAPHSVDAVVTDPPYGIGFGGERWDSLRRADGSSSGEAFEAWTRAWATACLRTLKPGGFLVAFGAPRTVHRLAAGIEDAGFELRDQLVWLYGSGIPKTALVEGRSSTLKPAYEPIVLARAPLIG